MRLDSLTIALPDKTNRSHAAVSPLFMTTTSPKMILSLVQIFLCPLRRIVTSFRRYPSLLSFKKFDRSVYILARKLNNEVITMTQEYIVYVS